MCFFNIFLSSNISCVCVDLVPVMKPELMLVPAYIYSKLLCFKYILSLISTCIFNHSFAELIFSHDTSVLLTALEVRMQNSKRFNYTRTLFLTDVLLIWFANSSWAWLCACKINKNIFHLIFSRWFTSSSRFMVNENVIYY